MRRYGQDHKASTTAGKDLLIRQLHQAVYLRVRIVFLKRAGTCIARNTVKALNRTRRSGTLFKVLWDLSGLHEGELYQVGQHSCR